jgi:hypothetical protein
MSNVIEFPMDRIRLSPSADEFFADKIQAQTNQLEEQMNDILNQAIALEEQSARVLEMMGGDGFEFQAHPSL